MDEFVQLGLTTVYDGDVITVKTGKTLKYQGGTDLQTQINNLDNLYSTDTERVNAVNTLVTNYTAADATLQNTLENTINTAVTQLNNETTTVYVDSNRSDSYTEDGSKRYPYKTLSAACTAKLANGSTAFYIFKLSPGTYSK